MKRDSELQRRIDRLQAQASEIDRMIPDAAWSDRPHLRERVQRLLRQIAMLTEDERRPAFAPPATKRSGVDEYRDWLKSVG